MKKWTLLVMMLVMVLGVGVSALAQEVPEETMTEETATEETTTEEPAPAQEAPESPAPAQEASESPAPSSEFTLGADGISVDRTNGGVVTNTPCFEAFRDEQIELASTGSYPSIASGAARACEGFGIANPYPAPYFYDTDGFLYTYDPIEGIYSAPDPATGLVYIYSPANGAFYTYDPATGAYL